MDNKFTSIVHEKTSEELLTIVYQFDQWDSEMLQAVEKELLQRQLLPEDISIRKQEMIEKETLDMEQGKQASLAGQILGWFGVLGLLGICIGYNYAFSKTRSKYTGKKYYKYDEPSRENGTYIFYTSLTILILYILYKLLIQNKSI